MKYEDFVCFIQTEVKERLGEGVQIELRQILKNNSVLLDGLSIQEKDKGIAPTVYLNDFYEEYQNGMTIPDILDCIIGVYEKNRLEEKFDAGFYTDYEKVKKHLACKLINREKNTKLLEKVPFLPFLDLAVVCYYRVSGGDLGNGAILVYKSHLENWGIGEMQLFRDAKENTLRILPTEFMNMRSLVEGSVQPPGEENGAQGEAAADAPADREKKKAETDVMYVLTNEDNYFGAVNIIFDSVLAEAGNLMGEDFWVLPSSIHECILVPVNVGMEKERLEKMVRQVNANEVAPEEFLADSVYFYHKNLHKLVKM